MVFSGNGRSSAKGNSTGRTATAQRNSKGQRRSLRRTARRFSKDGRSGRRLIAATRRHRERASPRSISPERRCRRRSGGPGRVAARPWHDCGRRDDADLAHSFRRDATVLRAFFSRAVRPTSRGRSPDSRDHSAQAAGGQAPSMQCPGAQARASIRTALYFVGTQRRSSRLRRAKTIIAACSDLRDRAVVRHRSGCSG